MPVVIRGISSFFLLLVGATAVGAVLAAVGAGPVLVAGVVLVVLGGWAVSLCLHEFAHALVAHRSGDWSVQARGYLTLDIRRYTNVALTFVLPVLSGLIMAGLFVYVFVHFGDLTGTRGGLLGILLPSTIPAAGIGGWFVAARLKAGRPAAFASMGASRV